MIRLPATVTILGKQYPLKVVDEPTQQVSGWIDDGIIFINFPTINKKDIDNDIMYTIFHEMGHALFRRSSLMQAIDSSIEEIVVDVFAKMVVENFDCKFRKLPIVLPD